MTKRKETAQQIFDRWAVDYHADGMENSHWQSVRQVFRNIPQSNGNYLEIGIGNGYGIGYMASHQYDRGMCYGLDVSTNMVKKAQRRLKDLSNVYLEQADFLNWEPPENIRFSSIFSMEVFYYFSDPQTGISRAMSFLEPEGRLFVLVNYYLENKSTHSWPEDLNTSMTLWSEKEYKDAFVQAGLTEIQQMRINPGPDDTGTLCTIGTKE